MRNFERKSSLKNFMHSKPVLVVLAIFVLFFAWGVAGFMGKMQVTAENRKILEKKVAELEQQKAKLSTNLEKLKTEDGIEESIREKFGLAKEGEGEIVVVDEKPVQKTDEESSGGFWGFVKKIFK